MSQAATLLGGKFESSEEGFTSTFDDNAAELHINKGSNKVWETNATKAIVEAITKQLNARLVHLGTDDTQ